MQKSNLGLQPDKVSTHLAGALLECTTHLTVKLLMLHLYNRLLYRWRDLVHGLLRAFQCYLSSLEPLGIFVQYLHLYIFYRFCFLWVTVSADILERNSLGVAGAFVEERIVMHRLRQEQSPSNLLLELKCQGSLTMVLWSAPTLALNTPKSMMWSSVSLGEHGVGDAEYQDAYHARGYLQAERKLEISLGHCHEIQTVLLKMRFIKKIIIYCLLVLCYFCLSSRTSNFKHLVKQVNHDGLAHYCPAIRSDSKC